MVDANLSSAAAAILGITLTGGLFVLLLAVLIGFLGLFAYWFLVLFSKPRTKKKEGLKITVKRVDENPVMRPVAGHWWESEAVFNPAAFVDHGRVHLLYRAVGGDGVSRIGYASSADGIHFDERLPYPVYDSGPGFTPTAHDRRYLPLSYNTDLYASGGSWGGCEDPRAVVIDDHMYMTFGIFESWQSMRLGVTALSREDLKARNWAWLPHVTMSPKNETNKNWVLFPEKLNGKYAILHALTPSVMIEYVNDLAELHYNPIKSNNKRSGRKGHWDAFVRGVAAPPMKTEAGWLLFYHGMNPDQPEVGYKVGAMLLDLDDPTKILYRSSEPVLEPKEWYENDWKPGVVYASGAVIFGDDLILYYGGGDKYIAAAKVNYKEFLHALMQNEHAQLHRVKL